jgi:hypothetical protein
MQNYKLIPLTQDKFAIVDMADYDWLMGWSWRYNKRGYCLANVATGKKKPRQRIIKMHRLIMNFPEGMEVDHINGDTLDTPLSEAFQSLVWHCLVSHPLLQKHKAKW